MNTVIAGPTIRIIERANIPGRLIYNLVGHVNISIAFQHDAKLHLEIDPKDLQRMRDKTETKTSKTRPCYLW